MILIRDLYYNIILFFTSILTMFKRLLGHDYINCEESDYESPVNKAVFNKIGAGSNYLIEPEIFHNDEYSGIVAVISAVRIHGIEYKLNRLTVADCEYLANLFLSICGELHIFNEDNDSWLVIVQIEALRLSGIPIDFISSMDTDHIKQIASHINQALR